MKVRFSDRTTFSTIKNDHPPAAHLKDGEDSRLRPVVRNAVVEVTIAALFRVAVFRTAVVDVISFSNLMAVFFCNLKDLSQC